MNQDKGYQLAQSGSIRTHGAMKTKCINQEKGDQPGNMGPASTKGTNQGKRIKGTFQDTWDHPK